MQEHIDIDDIDLGLFRTHLAWRVRRIIAAFGEQEFRAVHIAAVLAAEDPTLLKRYVPSELRRRVAWILSDMKRRGAIVHITRGTWKNP